MNIKDIINAIQIGAVRDWKKGKRYETHGRKMCSLRRTND